MKATQLIGGISPKLTTQVADFTIGLDDAGSVVRVNKETSVAVTVPADASVNFPIGTTIVFEQSGAGNAVLTAAVDVTINVLSTKGLTTKGTSAVATIVKVAANTWTAYGDLFEAPH